MHYEIIHTCTIFIIRVNVILQLEGNCTRDNDCRNGGSCDVASGTCSCEAGYTGGNCESELSIDTLIIRTLLDCDYSAIAIWNNTS